MKKKKRLLGLVVLVLVIGIFVINYTKPVTISELSQGVEITQYQAIEAVFIIAPEEEHSSFETSKQEELNAIFDMFSNQKFRKSLGNLVNQTFDSHRVEDGDFSWYITFQSDEIVMPNGNSTSGDILKVSNFYGDLEIRFNGESYICTTDNQEEWLKSVIDLFTDFEQSYR